MKDVRVVTSLFVACSLAAMGQGYDVMPADERIVLIGAGTGYEGMKISVRGGTLCDSCSQNPTSWNPYATSTNSTATALH